MPATDKTKLLAWYLKNDQVDKALVFVNQRFSTQKLAEKLRRMGLQCDYISGDVPQVKRFKILESFRSGNIPVLIATDVAARGIHVDGISHVFNFDIPYKPKEYVHRIGRTGRAGTKGKAISFVCESGGFAMQEIEETLGQSIKYEQPDENQLSRS